jgi:hypothetical protein
VSNTGNHSRSGGQGRWTSTPGVYNRAVSFELGQQPDRGDLALYPKVARQHALAVRGAPVPAGIVLDLIAARLVFAAHEAGRAVTEQDPAMRWVRARFAAGERLIARSARAHEDSDETSGAGLGMSVAALTNLRELEGALAMIEIHSRTLSSEPEPMMILIQREIPRRALLVVVSEVTTRFYVEVHGPSAGPEPLADGRSPDWSGALSEWPDPSRAKVEALALGVAASEGGEFGADLEIIVDRQGEPWLVQARPLTAPLHPGWPAFADALREEGVAVEQLRGRMTLDGEHNPAPLSPAHAWVMRRLGVLRPGKAGDPLILAGWLYVRALAGELGDTFSEPLEVGEALVWLRDEALPGARAALERFDQWLASGPKIRLALERAEALFVGMIDGYVGTLIPARRAALHRMAHAAGPLVARTGTPVTLRERGAFLDVLPAVWDIASPSLGELLAGNRVRAADEHEIPADELTAARLLGEWDDHLFALGLAPLRRLWLYAGQRLGLDHEQVFLLGGDELIRLDDDREAFGPPPLLAALLHSRAHRWAGQHTIDPPTRIVDGVPLPHPIGGLLRGLAVGESFTGVVAQRRDLRDLLADPPPAGAVLCMPALTAQAAVALHELGIRAVCAEYGGALSHGVLMARELGLSALIGCRGCTRVPEGTLVHLDTRARKLW